MYLFNKTFRQKDQKIILKKTKELSMNDLTWKPLDYIGAKNKYRFNIYSRREGAISRYIISQEQPRGFWQELSGKPGNVTFEESVTDKFMFCRLLKSGVPEYGAVIKIPRKA